MDIEKDIEKIIKENGDNINFKIIYEFEVKVRDGKPVSILVEKEKKEIKIIYKIEPKSGNFGYDNNS